MPKDNFRLLAKKYIQNQCSDEEIMLLFEYIKEGDFDDILKEEIDKVDWKQEDKGITIDTPNFKNIMKGLKKKNKPSQKMNLLIHSTELDDFVAFLISSMVGTNGKTENSWLKVSTC